MIFLYVIRGITKIVVILSKINKNCMRQWIMIIGYGLLVACNNGKKNPPPVVENAKVDSPSPGAGTSTSPHPLTGNWVGMLGENKLNVQLLRINGTTVEGRSVAAGNFRTLAGKITETGDAYTLHLEEPGDDKYDGVFDISVKKNGMVFAGEWVPFDKKLQSKPFTLAKRDYVYKPDAGLYPDASSKLLKEDDLLELVKEDLRVMRNSIYARHGYSFKMKDMRSLFDKEDWYMPMNTDVRGELTAIEKKNEALIKRYEKYAAEFYDDFGR